MQQRQNKASPLLQNNKNKSQSSGYKSKTAKKKSKKTTIVAYASQHFSVSSSSLISTVENTKQAITAFIGHMTQAPKHLIDNEYITGGYRINHNGSKMSIFKSLFKLHNESMNVWSHLFGLLLFVFLIWYSNIYYQSMKGMTSYVMSGLERAQEQNLHISNFFKDQLNELQTELEQIKMLYQAQQEMNSTQNVDGKEDLNSKSLYDQVINAMHKVEGMAHIVVKEMQHFQHFLSEEEHKLEEKLYEWKEDAYSFPIELQEKMNQLKEIFTKSFNNEFYYLSRLEYLNQTMTNFQYRVEDFYNYVFERIDKMEWLDLKQSRPITDVDQYLGYVSRWPLFAHMISACLCLGFSAFFHLYFVYSPKWCTFLGKLDYSGIIILIFGSNMAPINYYFSCGPAIFWRKILFTQMSVASIITFVCTMHPFFNNKKFRKFRGLTFVLLGVSGVSIFFVLYFFRDPKYIMEPKPFLYVLGGVIYLVGALLYVARIPERLKPGLFNIFGHSHQLFHICVVVACFIHYKAALDCYFRRQQFICPIE